MAISFTRYIDITSGVIAGAGIRQRELITRIFTENPLLPTNTFAEFESFAEVSGYFGSSSQEALMAEEYFAFISKTNTQPQKISFASWVNAATAPKIFGAPNATATLAQLNLITSGSVGVTLAGVTTTAVGIDLSGAGSLTAVAAALQVAIRAAGSGANITGCLVAWNAFTGAFDFTGGAVGVCTVAAVSTPLGIALGWVDEATIYSNGSAAMSLTATMIASTAASNNFGTFTFVPVLTSVQWAELAAWNATQNNMFMALVPVASGTASAISAALSDLPGMGMTLAPTPTTDFPHLFPGMILAATDYTQRNASQNYMFQIGDFAPSVTDDADADTYDALTVNYYGETQTAGQLIKFYQRGVLTGLPSSPTDMNIYANEIWFKDAVGARIMALLLAVNQISPNLAGRTLLTTQIQSIIQQALFNGTISVGTVLNPTQIAVITQIAGDPRAYFQVQASGYWLNVGFVSVVLENGDTQWSAVYTLIYKKNDAIRSVKGTHDLV